MALTLDQFVTRLQESGIIPADTLEKSLPPHAAPKDPGELAKQLIKQNLLTKYQAQEVYQGRGKGLVIGGYTILDKIGAGGMGQVFKAQHRRMDRLVAIKMLPASFTKDASAIARFERETKAAAKLLHSNIVTAFDADQAGGVCFLVMEYVEGIDLAQRVQQQGRLSVDQAVEYILQAARGLEYAHKKGIVHRDIKPANLLLDAEGTVKILDMGLARLNDPSAAAQDGLTQSGQVMGTVDYMAPEQAFDTRHADARADIYSLGCSLYRLLVGENVYGGETLVQKLLNHREAPIPDLRAKRPDVPRRLDAVFQRMVAKKPEKRFQTMSEVAAALAACRGAVASGVAATPGTSVAPDEESHELDFLKQNGAPALRPGSRSGTEVTLSGASAEVETDPKSEVMLRPGATAGRKPSTASVWRQRPVLIGAGAGGLVLLLLAVWVIVHDQNGEEVAKIKVPDGGAVTVQPSAKPEPPKSVGRGPQPEASGSVALNWSSAPPLAMLPTGGPFRWPLAASDRNDILWLLWLGARVTLRTGATTHLAVTKDTQLPAGPATIVGVELNPDRAVRLNDDALHRLSKLPDIESLQLEFHWPHSPQVSIAGVSYLGALANLRTLRMDRFGTPAADSSQFLSHLKHLELLSLGYWQDPNWSKWVGQLGTLQELDLAKCTLDDDRLLQLCMLARLKSLSLRDIGGTSAGIKRLAQLIPLCRITRQIDGHVVDSIEPRPNNQAADAKGSFVAELLTSPDYDWLPPENLGSAINTPGRELCPTLTSDERIIVFSRNGKLQISRRASREGPFAKVEPLPDLINGLPDLGEQASLSGDGLLLAFRARNAGSRAIWLSTRNSVDDPLGAPVPLAPPVNTPAAEDCPLLSPDGLTLYLTSTRPGKLAHSDVFCFTRKSLAEPFDQETSLGPNVNTVGMLAPDWISADSRALISTVMASSPFLERLHVRASPSEPFGVGQPFGPSLDTLDCGKPWVSPDGQRMYFHAYNPPGGEGGLDIWMTRRVRKRLTQDHEEAKTQ